MDINSKASRLATELVGDHRDDGLVATQKIQHAYPDELTMIELLSAMQFLLDSLERSQRLQEYETDVAELRKKMEYVAKWYGVPILYTTSSP